METAQNSAYFETVITVMSEIEHKDLLLFSRHCGSHDTT